MRRPFAYDLREDPAFNAVMDVEQKTWESCCKKLCETCRYHRTGEKNTLVVCFGEKLADALIAAGLIDKKGAAKYGKPEASGRRR